MERYCHRVAFSSIVLLSLLISSLSASELEMLVLMHGTGRVERYSVETGLHVGTLISGLPPSNSILLDADGRLLISTGNPQDMGTVLRYDPASGGHVESLINVPEGYGGRLHRATGMCWYEGDLLVASQNDGKVKRYAYPSGEWQEDIALATPGGMTQIVSHNGLLYVTDYQAQAIRQSKKLDGGMTDVWAQFSGQHPWGLAIDAKGTAYWSTSANRILRTDSMVTSEFAGSGGGIATPLSLTLGPDGLLYCASWLGPVTAWRTDSPNQGAPHRTFDGPEVKGPISIVFTERSFPEEYVYVSAGQMDETPAKLAFFESHIRPMLQDHCVDCHNNETQEGGLRLDARSGWEFGGKSGPAIQPGKPEDSLVYQAITYLDKDLQMPPDSQLSKEEIALFREWIATGAIDPRAGETGSVDLASDSWTETFLQRLDWWSLKPMVPVAPPETSDVLWGVTPVDRFIRFELDRSGLQPAPPASAEDLLRRVSFVLTGLPPTAEQRGLFIDAWQRDAEAAYQSLVDALLASPHYGEAMARRWMDVVRYTDTYGYEWDNPAKGSHEYRDYLIRAFNKDIGFDTILREQIAGDLLPQPRVDSELGIIESLIGPMFYHMGEHRHGSSRDFNGIHQEMVNNKIDALSKAFLATTVACSRCHDHKLEAVSQKDYYALGAMLITPRWASRPVDAPQKNAASIARLSELRESIRDELAAIWRDTTISPENCQQAVVVDDSVASPALGDVDYPFWKLLKAGSEVESAWKLLQSEWLAQRATRLETNKSFEYLADFATPQLPPGWVMEGDGIETGWVNDGTPLIALDGEAIVSRLLPRGLHTHALSSKLPGVLRMPPQHTVPGNIVSVNLAGGEFAGTLILDENAIQSESVAFLNQLEPSWRSYGDLPQKNGVTRVTIDFATSSLNSNFPPRTGLAPGLSNNDFGFDKRSWLSITGIVSHDAAGTPLGTLDLYANLYSEPIPQTPEEAKARISDWMSGAVIRWCDRQLQPGDTSIVNWLLAKGLLPNQQASRDKLALLVEEYRRVEQAIQFPRTVNSMDERSVAKSGLYFNVRGNVDAMGDVIMPAWLSMFGANDSITASSGSGRLELAESLLQPEHPLTSRVYVNRVWQWVFGTAIVASPDDFGRLGDRPSHPELLDWLARDFMRQRWSTKALIRQLVMSQTFRQSGRVDATANQRDPANRLRHHYPTRRLEAEQIRDSLLSVSGCLDPTLFGRPILPPRTVEDGSKRLFSGPVDGHGRRSLYLMMSIMAPPKFLVAFDLPDLKLPSGRRNITNVPTQALLLLNDPLVEVLSRRWAEQLVKLPHRSPAERIDDMFVSALARYPTTAESERWKRLFGELRTATDPMLDELAWAQIAHTLFNTKEFIHYR